ncbi:hypothetical protein H9L19_06540 [Weissella diestrammenae]|uniref:Uncharacterized protein n=1 Tax=Weissella diestrammenae TaxID=1162633 RepID=A0A7G9T4L3_9LACO|nr:hypothetical protein [Weissella diestrammenae]MCM0582063.1 hypothetical protein [Weissella diestrammenae]QNN75038.1 hypothetical protein H9L19_06540 [Weissella diestrammenae]
MKSQKQIPAMSMMAIGSVLYTAYLNQSPVQIQTQRQENQLLPEVISGLVRGYGEKDIYVGDVPIRMSNLRWAALS